MIMIMSLYWLTFQKITLWSLHWVCCCWTTYTKLWSQCCFTKCVQKHIKWKLYCLYRCLGFSSVALGWFSTMPLQDWFFLPWKCTFSATSSIKLYSIHVSCMYVIPFELVTISKHDKLWITPVLKLLIERRWQAFRARDWPRFSHYRLNVETEIGKAKRLWADKHKQTRQCL